MSARCTARMGLAVGLLTSALGLTTSASADPTAPTGAAAAEPRTAVPSAAVPHRASAKHVRQRSVRSTAEPAPAEPALSHRVGAAGEAVALPASSCQPAPSPIGQPLAAAAGEQAVPAGAEQEAGPSAAIAAESSCPPAAAPEQPAEVSAAPEPAPPPAPPIPPTVRFGKVKYMGGGEIPLLERMLKKKRSTIRDCAADHGGLEGRRGSVGVQFLVRSRGRAEGVEIVSARGLSPAAQRCIHRSLKNVWVGSPSADPVGVSVSFVLSTPVGKRPSNTATAAEPSAGGPVPHRRSAKRRAEPAAAQLP